jgi:hypothetical protein
MASLFPTRRLNNVDLPTLGLPTITTMGVFISTGYKTNFKRCKYTEVNIQE